MSKRPYFKFGIKDLIKTYNECGGNKETLQALDYELGHRKTPKAKELHKKVQADLRGHSETTPKTKAPQQPKAPRPISKQTSEPSPRPQVSEQSQKGPSSDKVSNNGNGSDRFYTKCKLIEPIGVSPRPNKFIPKLKDTMNLDFRPDDPILIKMQKGVAGLISELRSTNRSNRRIVLEGGKRIYLDGSGMGYSFKLHEEIPIFEGAKFQAVVDGSSVDTKVIALLDKQIILSFEDDFEETIRTCVIVIDNTALLEALKERLTDVIKGDIAGFNHEMANDVFTNQAQQKPIAPLPASKEYEDINQEQINFVETALGNDVVYLWGPPGTGKTKSLSVLLFNLYQKNKRILITSNTNQAVDELILKLCQHLEQIGKLGLLKDGLVIREGKIGHPELISNYQQYVTLDALVKNKSSELDKRKNELEASLHNLSKQAAHSEKILKKFERVDALKSEVNSVMQDISSKESNLRHHQEMVVKINANIAKRNEELEKSRNAGVLGKLFSRSPENILADIKHAEMDLSNINKTIPLIQNQIGELKADKQSLENELSNHKALLANEDYNYHKNGVRLIQEEKIPLSRELGEINRQLSEVEKTLIENCRVLGATATKAYLTPSKFSNFDVIIIDEASMLLLPVAYFIAGLAKEKVIISGDFRQLPPIVPSGQKQIVDLLGQDIFEYTGIAAAINDKIGTKRLVKLTDQYRMEYAINDLVSRYFYDGDLKTALSSDEFSTDYLPPLLKDRLIIVDTSELYPFSNKDMFKSKYNIMHSLVIRNICLHLHEAGVLKDNAQIGIATPYAAQAKLHRKLLEAYGLAELIDAGTVHRYQGGQKSTMIIDIPDSIGDWAAGIFIQADNIMEDGAKLLNVALSRAKESLIVCANLTHLDAKLPSAAILRGILFDIQNNGTVINGKDILSLKPITDDHAQLIHGLDLDFDATKHGLFHENDFDRAVNIDYLNAQKSIIIFSGFITPNRVASLGEVIRQQHANGIKIRCVTKPPKRNGSIPEEDGREALFALEQLGATVDLRHKIHEKVVLIDDDIAWVGSLNPLSYSGSSSEVMFRISGKDIAGQIADFLSIGRLGSTNRDTANRENPICQKCNSWTVFNQGRYGPYFYCEKECGYTVSLNKSR